MNQFKATTNLWIDKRRSVKDGTFPLKIRITYQRKSKLYRTEFSFTSEEFEKIMDKSSRGESKVKRGELHALIINAENVIDEIGDFTFDKFEKSFFGTPKNKSCIVEAFENHIEKLTKQGQVSTASTFQTALNSILKYRNNRNLDFRDVTPGFLEGYENQLRSDNYSPTTISINTRCIRRLFNLAIIDGTIKQDYYPFGKGESGKYTPPAHQNHKKALPKETVKKIYEYQGINNIEQYNRDLWLFSYLCNGMNMADIFRLKYSNLDNEVIYFLRQKTSHNRKLKPVIVSLTEPIKAIIDRWGTKPEKPDQYIFSVLTDKLTPTEELKRVKQATKQVNKYIKKIAKSLGLGDNITTYTARHSFATILKNSGENVAYISEALGHSNIRTTENYLAAFDNKRRADAAKLLTDW
jgi:integrase/recombinase XerD